MMERDFAKDVVRQSYRPLNLLQNTTQLMNLLIKACKDKGFNVDAEQLTSSFNAYNESGYKLSLGNTPIP